MQRLENLSSYQKALRCHVMYFQPRSNPASDFRSVIMNPQTPLATEILQE